MKKKAGQKSFFEVLNCRFSTSLLKQPSAIYKYMRNAKTKFEQILRMLPYSMCAKLWVKRINKHNKAENTLSVYIHTYYMELIMIKCKA